ncbi:LIM domain containing protein ajuba [Dissostichus eleginoides]|uniref:LIM domain containing protein ajuba n=1 Tax=Dissostichus eleginoides TaxID=100907 RepID=A0AAD9BWE8_DISEL|nr:LIM domain containing protein ajuba [Dissostichus eleginoides]
MDRPISKLLEKLKLTDSGSVKFNSSKKKHDSSNNSNNSNANTGSSGGGGGGGGPGLPPAPISASPSRPGQFSLASATTSDACVPATPLPTAYFLLHTSRWRAAPLHPGSTEAPLSPAESVLLLGEGVDLHMRRESGLGPECDILGAYGSKTSLNQRRYSLELQQLVRRRLVEERLLSAPPPYPASMGYGSAPRGGLAEPGYLSEPERHKRLSLQEALFYKRLSTGSELWENPRPASLSHPPHRSSDVPGGVGGGFFYPPGPTLSPCSSFSLQESLLHGQRRGGGSPMGSRCSSNRTSGISLGYDSRYSASGGFPPQQQSPSMQPGGPASGYGGPGRAGVTPVEAWTQYLEGGMRPGAYDSRHSYPPAVGSPGAACFQTGPEWWVEQQAEVRGKEGDRARYSDLPGTRYQEELTRLLLRDNALAGGGLMEGLALSKPSSTVGPCSAGGPLKPQEEPGGAGREGVESRQEFFGTCVKCGKGVYGADNACQALDSLYHTRCFTCVSCGRTLRNKDFYNVSGSVYCKEDYMFSGFQANAEKCSVCGHLILEQKGQFIQNVGYTFEDKLQARKLNGNDPAGSGELVPPRMFPLCGVLQGSGWGPLHCGPQQQHLLRGRLQQDFCPEVRGLFTTILPTEGSEEILRVVSMNKDYHFECYHCEECGKQLSDKPGSQCFPLDSHLLCHSCHMTRACDTHNIPPHNTH